MPASSPPVSVHCRTRRGVVDVPQVMAGSTDVALCPAALVCEQRSHRVAVWALGGRQRFMGVDFGAWDSSGSTSSRHALQSTGNRSAARCSKVNVADGHSIAVLVVSRKFLSEVSQSCRTTVSSELWTLSPSL